MAVHRQDRLNDTLDNLKLRMHKLTAKVDKIDNTHNINPKYTKRKREARQDKIITKITTGMGIDLTVVIDKWHLEIEMETEVELGMSNLTDNVIGRCKITDQKSRSSYKDNYKGRYRDTYRDKYKEMYEDIYIDDHRNTYKDSYKVHVQRQLQR